MAALSYAQLEAAWIQGGGDPAMAPLMAAIAEAESGGNANATNPTDNNGRQTSWGLWQISNGDHSTPAADWNDPVENARLAVGKLKSQGLGAWGTYTSGAYRRYLQSGTAPAGSVPGPAPMSTQGGTGDSSTLAGIEAGLGAGIPGLGALASGTINPLAAIGSATSGLVNIFRDFDSGFTNIMHAVIWLINPMNWVRILAGIVGAACLITGTVFVAKAA